MQLVGREREQAVLHEAVARVSDGAGAMYLVAGDSGTGKTALIETVLTSNAVWVVRGGLYGGGTAPYGPIRAALRDHLRRSPVEEASCLGVDSPSLGLVLPELSLSPEAAAGDDLPLAIRGTFERLGRQRPTVVFLDDLQWADAATLAVLADWAASPPGSSLLVIGAYRTDELPRQHPLRSVRATLRRAVGPQHHVHLGPLTAATVIDSCGSCLATALHRMSSPQCSVAPTACPSSSRS